MAVAGICLNLKYTFMQINVELELIEEYQRIRTLEKNSLKLDLASHRGQIGPVSGFFVQKKARGTKSTGKRKWSLKRRIRYFLGHSNEQIRGKKRETLVFELTA